MKCNVFAPQCGEKKDPRRIGDGGDKGLAASWNPAAAPHLPHCLRRRIPVLSALARGEDTMEVFV